VPSFQAELERQRRWERLPGIERAARPGTAVLTFDDGPDAEGTPAVLVSASTKLHFHSSDTKFSQSMFRSSTGTWSRSRTTRQYALLNARMSYRSFSTTAGYGETASSVFCTDGGSAEHTPCAGPNRSPASRNR
jgi:hypothetical protein